MNKTTRHKVAFCFKLIFLFLPFTVYTQATLQDSIAMVKKLQQEARNDISDHDFESAIRNLNKARKIVAPLNNNQLKAEVKLSDAELNYYLENFQKAAEKSIIAIQLLTEMDDKADLGYAYTLNGLILTKLGKFEAAEAFINKSDEIFASLNDEKSQANVIFAKGLLEQQRGNPKSAVNYFDASLPFFEANNMPYQLAFANLNKAEALLLLPDDDGGKYLEQAKKALQNAKDVLNTKNYNKLEVESFKLISLIAIRENDPIKADQFLKLYAQKKDSLYKVYIDAISSELDIESNIGDLNEKIAAQQTDLDKQQQSIIFNQATTGLSIALILILSLLTLSLYKNNHLRAKANNLLKDKNIELTLAKEKAEKASLAKAQFLSTITHELRTPLYAVTGLTHLLMEDNPNPNQKEHLNSLKFSGDYLLSLINNILDLNKLEANKVEIEKTTFDLKKRINDVLVALKKSADDRNNMLHFEYDETIPNKLSGDSLKLSQILINLIGNSVKFTQSGDVTVRIKKLDRTKDKVQLHFEIEDNGVGISKKKQKSIFETFSQGSLQINRKFGGTGLGLSIVKNLLELMNSKINLESELGKGSKFWFNITFDIVSEFTDENIPLNTIRDVDYIALENKTVLVVEDNKINQMITKKILEKNRMNCMVADNGLDAVEMVKENNFDVILMDIHMPGISGIEATQKIRVFNKNIPIIALTAVTIDENLDDFYRAGFNEIIPKPFKPEDFFEKIYRTLQAKNATVNN